MHMTYDEEVDELVVHPHDTEDVDIVSLGSLFDVDFDGGASVRNTSVVQENVEGATSSFTDMVACSADRFDVGNIKGKKLNTKLGKASHGLHLACCCEHAVSFFTVSLGDVVANTASRASRHDDPSNGQDQHDGRLISSKEGKGRARLPGDED